MKKTLLSGYILPRLIQFFVVVFIGITVVFVIPRLSSSDPIEQKINDMTARGDSMDPAALQDMRTSLRQLYGLEGSNWEQYIDFWKRLAKGDFGPSLYLFPTSCTDLILTSMPWTVGLLLVTTLLSWIIGTILGALAGFFSDKRWSRIMETICMSIRPIPFYIMGLFMVILFAYVIPIFPTGGGYTIGTIPGFNLSFIGDIIYHSLLPAITMILLGIGGWFLQMRSMMATTVGEEYVYYAEVSGLPRGIIFRKYAMRNAILPQVTGLALTLGRVFGGALIVEQVFSYPGIGTLLFNAIRNADYNLIMAITMLSIFGIAVSVLLVDLFYPLIDPRVKRN